jgi:proline dehydrogenase
VPFGIARGGAPAAAPLLDRGLARALPLLPRRVVGKIASPYIAGPTLADACRVVAELNAAGKRGTVDVLGEEIATLAEAEELTQAYLDAFDALTDLIAGVSVKPTGLGLKLDPEACLANVDRLVARAEQESCFVRIDMEDASTTDATLDLYRSLRAAGRERVGIVLQARLRRTLDDVFALAELKPSVRLCKGIYLEPEEIAYTGFHDIRAAYVRCAEALLDAGCKVAFATHDDHLIAEAKRLTAARGLEPEQVEFQLLLGVRPKVGDALVGEGYRVRVYVPYGERWYEYSLRRLQENPRIATAVAADTVLRAVPGGRR